MHFIEFLPSKWICVVTPDNIKELPPARHMKIEMKNFFLVDVCHFLFKKTHKKIGDTGKGVLRWLVIDIKNIYTVIAKNGIQPEP